MYHQCYILLAVGIVECSTFVVFSHFFSFWSHNIYSEAVLNWHMTSPTKFKCWSWINETVERTVNAPGHAVMSQDAFIVVSAQYWFLQARGNAIAQEVVCFLLWRPGLIAHSHDCPGAICNEQRCTEASFSLSTLVLLCQLWGNQCYCYN
jgi:hypothetical protein